MSIEVRGGRILTPRTKQDDAIDALRGEIATLREQVNGLNALLFEQAVEIHSHDIALGVLIDALKKSNSYSQEDCDALEASLAQAGLGLKEEPVNDDPEE